MLEGVAHRRFMARIREVYVFIYLSDLIQCGPALEVLRQAAVVCLVSLCITFPGQQRRMGRVHCHRCAESYGLPNRRGACGSN